MKDGNGARIALLTMNSFVFCLSIVVIGFGIWSAIHARYYADVSKIAGVSIGMGIFILLLSFMAFAGAARPHGGLLISFGVLILVMAIVALVLSGMALKHNTSYSISLANSSWVIADDFQKTVLQYQYTCCGFLNPSQGLPSTGCTSGGTVGCQPFMTSVLFTILKDLGISGVLLGSFAFFASIPAFVLGSDVNKNRERYV